MPTAVILLAAGSSSRLGQPKQLLAYEGQTLLRRAAETAVATGSQPVVVVTGAEHEKLLPELADLPVHIERNLKWEQGMGSSLQVGLAALEAQAGFTVASAVIVLLCDQPFVTAALLKQLVDTQATSDLPIVACEYAGVQGVPVLFAPEALPLLRTLPAAAGAGQLLKQHLELVATVPFAQGAIDVDTAEQYAALLESN